jgi:four helix bundle protein
MEEKNQKENVLYAKSYAFAVRSVNLTRYLTNEHKEFVLSKQILRSGTAIGALISESEFAQSKADFMNKLMIALKEANETKYWIQLLYDTQYINEIMYQSLYADIKEIVSLLVAITKTIKHQ